MTAIFRRGFLIATTVSIYLVALVGPFRSINQIYFLFVLGLISILINVSRAVDQILVVSISILGLIPIFGWISIPSWFNPLQAVIAGWFCIIAADCGCRFEKSKLIVSFAPLMLAPIFSFQWWKGMSEGDPIAVLTRILPIWDLSGHFYVFHSNLIDNTYIPRKMPPGENLLWAIRDYPTGIHYVWAQFAKNDKLRVLENSELAIPIFTNSVVVTLVFSTLVISLSAWRLAHATYLRIAYSMICSGVAVALITLGPLSQTITTGFANIPPVIISMSVFLSFALKPHKNKRIQLLILGASVLCIAYNWYPILLLATPALILLLVRHSHQSSKLEAIGFLTLVSPLVALPLLQSLALGLSHIEEQGGVQAFPSGLLLTVLMAVAAIGLWVGSVTHNKLFLTLTLPAPILTFALAVWLRVKTDAYPYYFHKAALFTAAYSILAILFVLIATFGKPKHECSVSLSHKVRIVVAAMLMSFGGSQMFGYWGLDYAAFSGQGSAYGVLNRNEFLRPNDLNRPTASLIVNEARLIKDVEMIQKSCSTLMIPSEIGVSDKNSTYGWKGPLENLWFHALSNSLTTEAQQLSFMTAAISPVANDNDLYVDTIKKTFDPATTCVISSPKVISDLGEYSSKWKSIQDFID